MNYKITKLIFQLSSILLFGSCFDKQMMILDSDEQQVLDLLKRSEAENLSLNRRFKYVKDSYNLIKNNPTDTITLAYLDRKSNLFYEANLKDSSLFYDRLLNRQAFKISNDYYLARSHNSIAYYLKNTEKYDSAYFHYNKSKYYSIKLMDSSKVGLRLLSMGLLQKTQNDFFGSKETITEALRFLHPKKDKKYIASGYSTLATNHRKLQNFSDAIKYYFKAIKFTDSYNDKLIYQNNLAASYIDYQKYDDAIRLLNIVAKDSLLIKNENENEKENARVLDNLAYANWLAGEKIREKEFIKPLKIRIQNNDKRGQIASYTHLGEFYSKSKPKIAVSYFDSVIQLSKALKIPRAEKDALKFLMKLQLNNVGLRDRYVFLQDSLYEQELKVSTKFAKYKYDDKVTQEENSRLEKENVEKELEASQQRNQKTLYLAGLIFIAAVLGLSFYGFRQRTKRLKQKSKTDKLEAVLETEAELSRKLHDDHGGKLNQAMLLVERDADKTVILDKLDSVYKQTRDFSREINSVATGPNYWEELKATLEYSKPVEVELIFNGAKELDWSVVGHQTKTILFKVLNELVINMARHSKASQTVILFKEEKKNIVIYYEDNGVGASKESLLRKNGLQNTEKRIQAIEGSITFDSAEGKGFRAEIQIPK